MTPNVEWETFYTPARRITIGDGVPYPIVARNTRTTLPPMTLETSARP